MPKPAPLIDRMSSKIKEVDGCWEWTGSKNSAGYGRINEARPSRRILYAHRVLYELVVGPIPAGYEIDHLCCNPACVRPEHLEPVTQQVNRQRVVERKTHCAQGHLWIPENIYVRPGSGKRMCRPCYQERACAYIRRPVHT